MFLKISPWLTSTQSHSSHLHRCFVRPSITYFESLMICRSPSVLCCFTTMRMAISSPVWLDCTLCCTLPLMFLGSLSPYQALYPTWASSLPLFRQAPSVYTISVSLLVTGPSGCAGIRVPTVGSGSPKIVITSFRLVVLSSFSILSPSRSASLSSASLCHWVRSLHVAGFHTGCMCSSSFATYHF